MAANRAPKSGVALEELKKLQAKYDPKLASEILVWIANTTGESFDTSSDASNFQNVLSNGVLLCKLANALEPGSIKKINEKKYVDKTELFRSIDLAEGTDLYGVLTCLCSVARKSEKLFGKPGLGPKSARHKTAESLVVKLKYVDFQEATAKKREWTAEQLRGGETVIGLQMGSNKGATAAGINFGNTRHI
uniref:Calponin-homology (CH) domain-containing protein n=1 Tax=Syphacia muris TaxID=451379 RepID=A0A0N5AWB5_9BILA